MYGGLPNGSENNRVCIYLLAFVFFAKHRERERERERERGGGGG